MADFEERTTADEVVFEKIPDDVCEDLINHLASLRDVGFTANRERTSLAIPIGNQAGIQKARTFLKAA
jgi:hypothetical protein